MGGLRDRAPKRQDQGRGLVGSPAEVPIRTKPPSKTGCSRPGRSACWPRDFVPPVGWVKPFLNFWGAAQALAGEFDAMRVVHEAVEDGVGVGGVADDLVPGGQREL